MCARCDRGGRCDGAETVRYERIIFEKIIIKKHRTDVNRVVVTSRRRTIKYRRARHVSQKGQVCVNGVRFTIRK